MPLACLFALWALCDLDQCSLCPCQPVPKASVHLIEEISHSLQPRTYTEEELNAKLTRRVQKAARRQAKQEELKRLHRAQVKNQETPQLMRKSHHSTVVSSQLFLIHDEGGRGGQNRGRWGIPLPERTAPKAQTTSPWLDTATEASILWSCW